MDDALGFLDYPKEERSNIFGSGYLLDCDREVGTKLKTVFFFSKEMRLVIRWQDLCGKARFSDARRL